MNPAALAVVAAAALPPSAPARPIAARLQRATTLYDRPDGRRITTIRSRTEFGSRTVLSVAARERGWLGVRTPALPNGRLGWIRAAGSKILGQPHRIDVDLSERRMVVRTDGRVSGRYRVAIGKPGSHTPTGSFAVTDRISTGRDDGPYGCCILALTGHQPNLPQDWGGGDRLAIHGTSNEATIGDAVSSGCLRATRRTMRALMRRIPTGALVVIRA